MVDSNLIMKNRLAGQSWGGFSRVYVFLYNNMKYLVKGFHLLRNTTFNPHFLLQTHTIQLCPLNYQPFDHIQDHQFNNMFSCHFYDQY